jgi:hypothetical protein
LQTIGQSTTILISILHDPRLCDLHRAAVRNATCIPEYNSVEANKDSIASLDLKNKESCREADDNDFQI